MALDWASEVMSQHCICTLLVKMVTSLPRFKGEETPPPRWEKPKNFQLCFKMPLFFDLLLLFCTFIILTCSEVSSCSVLLSDGEGLSHFLQERQSGVQNSFLPVCRRLSPGAAPFCMPHSYLPHIRCNQPPRRPHYIADPHQAHHN